MKFEEMENNNNEDRCIANDEKDYNGYYEALKNLNLEEDCSNALHSINDIITTEDIKNTIMSTMKDHAANIITGYSIINDIRVNLDELKEKINSGELSDQEKLQYERMFNSLIDTADHTFNAITEDANQLMVIRSAYDFIK